MAIGLYIDTSDQDILLAVAKEGYPLQVIKFPHEQNLSKHLLPLIQTLLKNAKVSKNELDYIALGIGPGSYTGTRGGAAVAKGLAYGLSIPLIPICSLAFYIPDKSLRATVIMKTKAELYFAVFADLEKNTLETLKHQVKLDLLKKTQETPLETLFYMKDSCLEETALDQKTASPGFTFICAYGHSLFIKKEIPTSFKIIYANENL